MKAIHFATGGLKAVKYARILDTIQGTLFLLNTDEVIAAAKALGDPDIDRRYQGEILDALTDIARQRDEILSWHSQYRAEFIVVSQFPQQRELLLVSENPLLPDPSDCATATELVVRVLNHAIPPGFDPQSPVWDEGVANWLSHILGKLRLSRLVAIADRECILAMKDIADDRGDYNSLVAEAESRVAAGLRFDEGDDESGKWKPSKKTSNAPNKPATVNELMAAKLTSDPSLMGWSARQWSEHLGCSPQAVKQAGSWGRIITARALQQADNQR